MSDTLFGPIFDTIKRGLFEELRPRMQAAMATAFDEAWNAATQKLVQPAAVVAAAVIAAPEKSGQHRPKPPSNVGSRAAWGTTKTVIHGAFASPGFKGMTPKAIADWGATQGQRVAASSVRTTLQKMHKAGEVRIRQGKYFPKPPLEQRADESPADGGAEVVQAFKGAA